MSDIYGQGMKRLTVKEVAEHFEVQKQVVSKWVQNGLFPNAELETIPGFGSLWKIPESDLVDFDRPRRGKPRKEKQTA